MAEAGKNSPRLQKWIYVILRVGVVVSGLVLIGGLALVLVAHQPRPEAAPPTVVGLVWRVLHGDGVAVIYAGLLLLMLTPLVQVAAATLGWLVTGPRRFALAAALVLTLLVLSLWLGVG
jgi:uncharacterized membrane protein